MSNLDHINAILRLGLEVMPPKGAVYRDAAGRLLEVTNVGHINQEKQVGTTIHVRRANDPNAEPTMLINPGRMEIVSLPDGAPPIEEWPGADLIKLSEILEQARKGMRYPIPIVPCPDVHVLDESSPEERAQGITKLGVSIGCRVPHDMITVSLDVDDEHLVKVPARPISFNATLTIEPEEDDGQ